jgi:hypothetical protein
MNVVGRRKNQGYQSYGTGPYGHRSPKFTNLEKQPIIPMEHVFQALRSDVTHIAIHVFG